MISAPLKSYTKVTVLFNVKCKVVEQHRFLAKNHLVYMNERNRTYIPLICMFLISKTVTGSFPKVEGGIISLLDTFPGVTLLNIGHKQWSGIHALYFSFMSTRYISVLKRCWYAVLKYAIFLYQAQFFRFAL